MTLLGVTEASNLRIGMKRRDRFESPLLAYACAAEVDEAEGSGETTPAGRAFVLPLGSHALLLYKGSYNWNDNDFGLFVWGVLASEDNAGELHYKEL